MRRYLIINGAECEPYLADSQLMIEKSEEILRNRFRYCLGKSFIAIEDNKPEAIKG